MTNKVESGHTAANSVHRSRCNSTTLRKASRNLTQFYDMVLSECGLRATQRTLLIHVERAGTPSIGELAEGLVMDRTALSHALKPLVRDGLLSLVPDEGDRRSRRVALTNLGHRKIKESHKYWQSAQSSFEKYFGEERAQELRDLLVLVADFDFSKAIKKK